jgi:hypothetical protein
MVNYDNLDDLNFILVRFIFRSTVANGPRCTGNRTTTERVLGSLPHMLPVGVEDDTKYNFRARHCPLRVTLQEYHNGLDQPPLSSMLSTRFCIRPEIISRRTDSSRTEQRHRTHSSTTRSGGLWCDRQRWTRTDSSRMTTRYIARGTRVLASSERPRFRYRDGATAVEDVLRDDCRVPVYSE